MISGSMENRLYQAVRALHDNAWDELRLIVESRIAQAMGEMTMKAGRYTVSETDLTAHLDPKVKRFVVAIDGEIEASGLRARVGLRQKDAAEWDIRNTSIYDQIRRHVIKLAESTLADIKASTLEETQRVVTEMRAEVLAGQQAGENMRDRVKRIERFFGEESRWKARRIAVTEASRAANWGYLAATSDADWIVGYQWLLSEDACPQCKAVGIVNGRPRRVKKGSPFATGQSKDEFYATILAPPLHPGCVLGETPISAASLVAATHAKYQGPVVRLECSDGSRFAVTANHMLLTPSGFARAIDLVQGDDVIRTGTTPEGFVAPTLGRPDNHDRPATADEIFHAFRESGRVIAGRVPVAPEYLHGDATFIKSDIDVIRANGLLWGDTDSFLGQPLDHVGLVNRSDAGIAFDRQRLLASLLNSLSDSTDGGVSSARESDAVLWGSFRHTLKHGFGSVSWANSNFAKSANDHRARNAKSIGDTLDRFPGFVSTAKVVKIDVEFPQEPISVYDFETYESTYIICNGIVSSNCRCTLTGIIEDDAPREWDEAVMGNPDGTVDTRRVRTSVAMPKEFQLPLPLPAPMIVDPAAELEKAMELFGETSPGRPGEAIPPKKRNAS